MMRPLFFTITGADWRAFFAQVRSRPEDNAARRKIRAEIERRKINRAKTQKKL